MKAQASVETIGKWVLLLVILGIGIQFIINLSHDTSKYTQDISKENYNTSIVESESFSTSQIVLYMRSCASKSSENSDEDFTCYILKGDMSSVNNTEVASSLLEYDIDISDFSNQKEIASIEYDHITKTVYLKN